MNEKIYWNDLFIGEEQAETLAYSIYNDIESYVENHSIGYELWLIMEESEYVVISTIDGIILNDKSTYASYDFLRYDRRVE